MLMSARSESADMVRYQFQIDDETWQEWKMTVPRDKSLEQRITELIEADRDGRVFGEGADVGEMVAALADMEAALDRGDEDAAREALERAQGSISDGDGDE